MKKLANTTSNTPVEKFNSAKDEIWELNHDKINKAIFEHVAQYGTMPGKNHIAEATGLHRNTVYKHLRSFAQHKSYQTKLESMGMMTEHVMAQVMRKAMMGDLHAAKLFIEMTKQVRTEIKNTTQNNYVQINKTVINQQIIQQLNPAQKKRLEELIFKELNTEAIELK